MQLQLLNSESSKSTDMKVRSKSTYILLPLVLILWGIVAFKISKYLPDQEGQISRRTLVENKHVDYNLHLDYRNPFFEDGRESNKDQQLNSQLAQSQKDQKKEIQWPRIVYKGSIENAQKEKTVYIFEIKGKEVSLMLKEEFEDLQLIRGSADEVTFRYQKKYKKTIKKAT